MNECGLCSRRDFLKVVAAGAAVGGAAGCLVGAEPTFTAPAVDAAGRLQLSLAPLQAAVKVGAALQVVPAGGENILLMRLADADFRAVSGICTHAGCPLGYNGKAQVIECPCHGARFALDGQVLRRPAVDRVAAYLVKVQGDALQIDTRGDAATLPHLTAGSVAFALSTFPSLKKVDGAFVFTPIGMDQPVLVVRVSDSACAVSDGICTFGECVLKYDPPSKNLVCSCHGCSFDLSGAVQHGPATRALRTYATSFDGKTISFAVP